MSGGALSDYEAIGDALDDALRDVPTVLGSDDEEENVLCPTILASDVSASGQGSGRGSTGMARTTKR